MNVDINKLSTKEDAVIIISRLALATTKETFLKDISILEKLYVSELIYNSLKITKERIIKNVCRTVCKNYKKQLYLKYKLLTEN